jgi:hypothetical protein
MSLWNIFIVLGVVVAVYYTVHTNAWIFVSEVRGDIVLTPLEGQPKKLDDFAGENGTFIFYMSTWCQHCGGEIKQLKSLTDFFRTHKINVIMGIYGPSKEEIQNWATKQDLPWEWKNNLAKE